MRKRWFFDVSKVKESSFSKSDFTEPSQIFDAHRLENTDSAVPDFFFQWILYKDHIIPQFFAQRALEGINRSGAWGLSCDWQNLQVATRLLTEKTNFKTRTVCQEISRWLGKLKIKFLSTFKMILILISQESLENKLYNLYCLAYTESKWPNPIQIQLQAESLESLWKLGMIRVWRFEKS